MKFIRCRQGHVFDVDAADACPICGEVFVTRIDNAEDESPPLPKPVPVPPPVAGRWRPAAVAGALILAVGGVGVWYLYKPDPCKDANTAGPTCRVDVATTAKNSTAGRRDSATKPSASDIEATSPPKAPTPDEALRTAKTEPSKTEPSKTEPSKTEPPKTEPPKTEPPKTEPPKTEPPKTEPPKTAPQPAPASEPPKQQVQALGSPAKPKTAPEAPSSLVAVAPPTSAPPLGANDPTWSLDKLPPGAPAPKALTPGEAISQRPTPNGTVPGTQEPVTPTPQPKIEPMTPKRQAKLEDPAFDVFGPLMRKRDAINELKLSQTLVDQLEIESFKQSKQGLASSLDIVSKHGFAEATYLMALDDLGAKDDVARRLRGIKELKKAAAQGQAFAALNLAQAYCAGNVLPKDISRARAHALAAARENVFNKAVLACTGLSRSTVGSTASDVLDLAFKRDPRTLELAAPLVEAGVGGAMLAKAFYDIAHEPAHARKLDAFRLGERALRRGTSDAFALMAVTNGDGDIVPKNDAEALVWYKLAQVYTHIDSERKFLANAVQRRLQTIDPKVLAKIKIVAPFIETEAVSSSSKPPN